ncbi:transglutaminaseTgpA domain-containing protein [Actinomyces glycerinitolerans]|uniref:Transglutaminase-like domain-containing protein n=1 Tax=Actinomyces glycerinitolerans TaxID=1892869 RepID=A0A1M4RZQ0_9ACTO|nr:transglutaminaseTgpA domain-containing protein [Actinomyces glycerinitolerans]SHE25411.1 Hypothetical protein ACGLYG10_1627 [Actinomyces glycerinitolerans]
MPVKSQRPGRPAGPERPHPRHPTDLGARRRRRPHRRIPWAAPTAAGWQVILLALALTAGGAWAGLTLARNLGIVLAALAVAGLLAGWLLALAAGPRPRLTGPGDVHAGERAVWRLAVDTRLPRWMPLWAAWRVDGDRFLIPVVAGGCAIAHSPSRRGRLAVGVEGLTCHDPLGLVRARIPLGLDGDLLVLPRPLVPPPEAVAAADPNAATASTASAWRARGRAGGSDPGNLRDYRPGDSLGAVHWRQSARVDRLLVVERVREGRRPRRLRLDLRADAYAPDPDTAHSAAAPGATEAPGATAGFETAVSRAAGLLEAWARAGHDVELRLGADIHHAAPGGAVALLRHLAVVEVEPGTAARIPAHDADVVITGVAADPPPQPARGGVVLAVESEPDFAAIPAESASPTAPARPQPAATGARAAPSTRPPTRTFRCQPLAAALIVVGLWHLATTALAPLLAPEPWAARSLTIAAATLLLPALTRTVWPHRSGLACGLGLVAGIGALWWCWPDTVRARAWLADPVAQLHAVGTILRNGLAPLATGGALGFALCLFTLLLAWACALMSAGGGDRCGATGLAPTAALLAPGVVLGRYPDRAVLLAAAVGVVLLVVTSAPSGGPGWGPGRRHGGFQPPRNAAALTRAAGRLAGTAAVTFLATALATGALSRAPAVPTRTWSWNVSGTGPAAVSVPDTTLNLGEDLVRGSAATAFEYSAEGVAPGTGLRFTLAVIRDLDGREWEPLDDPGPTRADGLVGRIGSGALTAGGAVAAAGLSGTDVRSGAADLQRIHLRVLNLSSPRLPLPQSTVLIAPPQDSSDATALNPRGWAWVPGTSTVLARGADAASGSSYTALGWNAVAGTDGTPQVPPPYAAAAPASEALAAYTALPEGADQIAVTAQEVVDAAGLGGTGADPAARAAALAAWFHTGAFAYDESAPGGFDADAEVAPVETVTGFLTERRGYCIHYAAAFTLMARSLGLPTRIAIGYASRAGEATTAVSGRDLHAWPEVWFDDVGWVAFEPTPGGAGARADTGTAAQTEPTAATSATATASTQTASATPSAGASTEAAAPATGGAAFEGGPGRRRSWLLGVAGVTLLLAAPGLVRARRRRRRLARIRAGDRPATAAWEEVEDAATDLGLWYATGRAARSDGDALTGRAGPRARTHEALAEYLAAIPALDAAARRALAELAEAAVAEAFGGRERSNGDTESGDRRLVRLVRTGTAGLARTTSSVRRLRARALPASLWRRRH